MNQLELRVRIAKDLRNIKAEIDREQDVTKKTKMLERYAELIYSLLEPTVA